MSTSLGNTDLVHRVSKACKGLWGQQQAEGLGSHLPAKRESGRKP